MSTLDLHTFYFLRHIANYSGNLNQFLYFISGCDLITWVPAVALLWWAWFRDADGRRNRDRRVVISCLLACMFILAVFYILQDSGFSIGFRLRPMFNPSSGFRMPIGVEAPTIHSYWGTSSSFPSGHAAVLGALSIGLLLISRPIGVFAFVYSALICLLRVYFGIHYMSDVVAGGLMAIATIFAAKSRYVERALTQPIINASAAWPPIFYAAFFVLSYGVATGFSEARDLLHLLKRL